MKRIPHLPAALAAAVAAAVLAGTAVGQTSSPANSSTGATYANTPTKTLPSTSGKSATSASPAASPALPSTADPMATTSSPRTTAMTSSKSAPAKAGALSKQDKDFAQKAAAAGLAEVAAGKLAASNAVNGDVKKFGEHMAQDHSKANDELMQIAQSKNIQLPSAPDRSHQRFAKQLEGMKGDKFDRTYMREAGVKDHKAAVALFSNEAKKGKDPELRAFAEKTLPGIQEHLKSAEQLAQLSGKQ